MIVWIPTFSIWAIASILNSPCLTYLSTAKTISTSPCQKHVYKKTNNIYLYIYIYYIYTDISVPFTCITFVILKVLVLSSISRFLSSRDLWLLQPNQPSPTKTTRFRTLSLSLPQVKELEALMLGKRHHPQDGGRIRGSEPWWVSKSPKDRVVGPLPNGRNSLYVGVTNYLLSGMILQVVNSGQVFGDFVMNCPLDDITFRKVGKNHPFLKLHF